MLLIFGCTAPEAPEGVEAPEGTIPSEEIGYTAEIAIYISSIDDAQTSAALDSINSELILLKEEMISEEAPSAEITLVEALMLTIEGREYSFQADDLLAETADFNYDCSEDQFEILETLIDNLLEKYETAKNKAVSLQGDTAYSTLADSVYNLADYDEATADAFKAAFEEGYAKACPETQETTQTFTYPLSEEDALSIVVNEALADEIQEYYIYLVFNQIVPGDVITTEMSTFDDFERDIDATYLLFFADIDPMALFGHPTKFVFVDINTGEYFVTDETWYPIVNGISYFPDIEDRMDTDNIMYPTDVTFPEETEVMGKYESYSINYNSKPVFLAGEDYGIYFKAASARADIDCCDYVASKKLALIWNGDEEGFFQDDAKKVYDHITSEAGGSYPPGAVWYISPHTTKAGVDETSNKETLKKAFEEIGIVAECCDEVFIYITSHGSRVPVNVYKNKKTGKNWLYSGAGNRPANMTGWEFVETYDDMFVKANAYKKKAKPDGTFEESGDKAKGGWIESNEIAAWLNNIKSCDVTLVFDLCYSGYLGHLASGKGRTVYAASGNSETSKARPDTVDSIYTDHLIKALKAGKSMADAHAEAADKTSKDKKLKTPQTPKKYEPEGECKCPCYMVCLENYCYVFGGNGTDDELCKGKKPNDYCGPECGNGKLETGEDCETNITCPSENEYCYQCLCFPYTTGESFCGDDEIQVGEECELTKPCPAGYYCEADGCFCLPYTTTGEGEDDVPGVCGNGVVDVGEGCESDAQCPEDYVCSGCQCGPSTVCGDLILEEGEECETDAHCPESYVCVNCGCEYEAECGNDIVDEGEECEEDNDCDEDEECANCQCIPLPECGNDEIEEGEECEENSDCDDDEECVDCDCELIDADDDGITDSEDNCPNDYNPGQGDNDEDGIGDACDSVPIDCNEICSTIGMGILSEGSPIPTQEECNALAECPTMECHKTCCRTAIYGLSWPAYDKEYGCCCGTSIEYLPCPGDPCDCSGVECPDE